VNADDGEAILDAEYASAAAPSAAIVMASFTTFGGLIAMQNLINGPNPPAIISLSYGECEASNGATSNAAYNAIFQQGVATSFTYSLSATGGSLRYSITNLPSWLTVSAASGTVTTRATSITFRINTTPADRLAAGAYVSSINFNNTTNGQGNTARVATLNVAPKHYTIAQCRRHGQRRRHVFGRYFANGDRHTQWHPQLRPLDPERKDRQHVGELHLHAQCQRHPGRRFQVEPAISPVIPGRRSAANPESRGGPARLLDSGFAQQRAPE
jgi:hypothetical protein